MLLLMFLWSSFTLAGVFKTSNMGNFTDPNRVSPLLLFIVPSMGGWAGA